MFKFKFSYIQKCLELNQTIFLNTVLICKHSRKDVGPWGWRGLERPH